MKPLIILIASCFTTMSVFAQNAVTVNVTLNGNQNRELIVDGKAYPSTEVANQGTTRVPKKSNVTITDLLPGQHTLQVVRVNPNTNRRTNVMQKIFNLRSGYDLDVVVNGNGSIQLTEKRIRNRGRDNAVVRTPMSAAGFNTIVQDVRRQYGNTSKVSALSNVFGNTANYFTSSQVSQLVRLVAGEANRLQLLKSAYPTITDSENFSGLYSLLASTAGRQELTAYVNAYSPTENVPSSNTGGNVVAMANANYNILAAQIRNEYNATARVSAIYNAFSSPNNYFTTEQALRLIQLTTGEANMLHLAKASYRSITDKSNFTSIYNLIPTQAGRNDLAVYVNNYNPAVVYNGTMPGVPATGVYKTPMSDGNFAALQHQIRGQWLPGAKRTAVINAFSTGDFFTTAQAIQLIQLDNDESDRVEMAKASYKALTDPSNFNQVYNLFTNSAYRDELARYVTNYNSGTLNGNTSAPTGYNNAMSDVNFTNLLNSIRGQWLPGAKKTAVLNAFAAADYFTTAQAMQLIQLDNDEDDRLDMAKAAYRKVVDQNNFPQVYNLFTTQSFRDALVNYVSANR